MEKEQHIVDYTLVLCNRHLHHGFIAQLAEHKTENLGVVGSIPTEATICIYSSMDRIFGYEPKDIGSIPIKCTNYFMGS